MSVINKSTEEELYQLALVTWGSKAQLLMLAEELGELQHEVFKAIRKPDNFNRDAMAEEMADVHLMIGQIREGYNLHQQVEDWKQKKLHRLLEILSKHNKDQT